MFKTNTAEKKFAKRKKMMSMKNKIIFYIIIVIIPILHACVFEVYVNFQSILLAFQKYEIVNNLYQTSFTLENFKTAFSEFGKNWFMVKNSVVAWLIMAIANYPLSLLFSYYIFKKCSFGGLFKVILFAPNIISGFIMAILFKYMSNYMYPAVVLALTGETVPGLMAINSLETHFPTIIFFNIWTGFGTCTTMFLGSMGNINDSTLEAAKLDGATELQEFFYIIFPLIYSTFSTFLVLGITSIFTSQLSVYAFFKDDAGQSATWGYYLYRHTIYSDFVTDAYTLSFSELSAIGVIITMVVVPIVLSLRKLLDKLNPCN